MSERIHKILGMLERDRVEGRTFEFQGRPYAIPYQDIVIDGVKIKGLREVDSRIIDIMGIIIGAGLEIKSAVDIGSNTGAIIARFGEFLGLKNVMGVEPDSYYVKLSQEIFPGLNIRLGYLHQMDFASMGADLVTALSMIEYVTDKPKFVHDLFRLTNKICIVEGHSEDIKLGIDKVYEKLLKQEKWAVIRHSKLTDAGLNAPSDSPGRPLWYCIKEN